MHSFWFGTPQEMNQLEIFSSFWDSLPIELKIIILSHLDSETTCAVSHVSKSWMVIRAMRSHCQITVKILDSN